MDFITITINMLKHLSVIGGFGVGIILLTLIIRFAMWPLSVSQQRSMKTMQKLQPKMKAIQERYNNNPQVMQQKMMEFYKENKFNPMAGCLPLLLQMPIFILLYSSLMSPQFIKMAGDSHFLFINRLDTTLRSSAGISNDGIMGISQYDKFILGKTAKVYFDKETIDNVKIDKPNKALEIQGKLTPGEDIDFKVSLDSLDLKFSELEQIKTAEISVSNPQTRESELLIFTRNNGILTASMPTKPLKNALHFDVLALIVIFGLTMVVSQKAMMKTTQNADQDPAQAAIQKSMNTFMPIMLTATFVFIPIPAGVLLYLITSNVVQVIQTVVINKQLEREDEHQKAKIDEQIVARAKKVESKD